MNDAQNADQENDRWAIPESWVWSSMGEVAEVVGGGTPPTNDLENFGGDIPWITPADLSGYGEKKIARGARNITQRGLDASSARLMPAGAVLFSTRAPIGYVAVASNPVSTNQGFKSFVLDANLLSDYVYYYLQRARNLAIARASGTTFSEISGARTRTIPIPIAPVQEQLRIVAEVEKQLTRLEAGLAALKRVESGLARYRTSVLKAACEGRLVPSEAEIARFEARDYEHAESLLKRVLEKNNSWPDTDLPFRPDPVPEGWTWINFGALLREPLRNGRSAKRTDDPKGVRTLTLTAVTLGDFSESNTKRTRAKPEEVEELWLQPGDILIERSNTPGLVGTARMYDGPPNFAIFPDLLIRARVSHEIEAHFIEAFLRSSYARNFFITHAQGISGHMPKISQQVVTDLPVPLPPVAEQKRILAELDHQLSVASRLEIAVRDGASRAALLRASILKSAFEGRLIPQDLTDEPAAVFLNRLREAKNSMREGLSGTDQELITSSGGESVDR